MRCPSEPLTVARAVARNDTAMLLAALGPEGLKIGRKKYSRDSLAAALTGKQVLQVVAPRFYQPEEFLDGLFSWNASEPETNSARIWLFSGYGEQPTSS